MPDQTRHMTLMVTHPGGDGHLTLDHHVPVQAANELMDLLVDVHVPLGGRHVVLFAAHSGFPDLITREVDDATADRVVAAMRAHMPERGGVVRQVRADAADEVTAAYWPLDPADPHDRGVLDALKIVRGEA